MTSNAFVKSRKMQTDSRPLSMANFHKSTTLSQATVVGENFEHAN